MVAYSMALLVVGQNKAPARFPDPGDHFAKSKGCPTGGSMADEQDRRPKYRRALDANSEINAEIGFCFMTQFGQLVSTLKLDLPDNHIVQDTYFSGGGASGSTGQARSADPVFHTSIRRTDSANGEFQTITGTLQISANSAGAMFKQTMRNLGVHAIWPNQFRPENLTRLFVRFLVDGHTNDVLKFVERPPYWDAAEPGIWRALQ